MSRPPATASWRCQWPPQLRPCGRARGAARAAPRGGGGGCVSAAPLTQARDWAMTHNCAPGATAAYQPGTPECLNPPSQPLRHAPPAAPLATTRRHATRTSPARRARAHDASPAYATKTSDRGRTTTSGESASRSACAQLAARRGSSAYSSLTRETSQVVAREGGAAAALAITPLVLAQRRRDGMSARRDCAHAASPEASHTDA